MAGKITQRQFDVFRAIMATGSISAAARQLGVSQPGLSTTVRRLEDILGVTLFERMPGGKILPTPEAQRAIAEVERVYGQFERLAVSFKSIVRGEGATFSVGFSASAARKLGPMALARLVEKHKDIRLSCHTRLAMDRIVDYLCFGQGECVATLLKIEDATIESEVIAKCRIVCIVPNDHPFSDRSEVSIQDLGGHDLIVFEENSPHGAPMERLFAAAGLRQPRKFVVQSTETAMALAREGLGATLIDEFSAIDAGQSGLRTIPFTQSPEIPLYMHWHKYHPRSVLSKEFTHLMREGAQEILAAEHAKI